MKNYNIFKDDISCIYKIENLINGKIYIGSTSNFKKRFNDHLYHLRKKSHKNRHLQKSFNKNGDENFKIVNILNCSNEKLIEVEQWFLDNTKHHYNINKIANSCLGVKRSEETKRKLREINLGKKHTKETKKKLSKKLGTIVYQYDICGVYINSYNSIREAGRVLKINNRSINYCVNGKYKLAGGFIWRTNPTTFTEEDLKKTNNHKNKKKPVIMFDLNNNILAEYESIHKASLENNIDGRNISACCKNQMDEYKGYIFRYK